MMMFNVMICVMGFGVGAYTFIRHLNAFSGQIKTPTVDAWLTAVGTLGWSVLLYASFDEPIITEMEVFSRVLIFVYWVGTLLKIQKHCLRLRQRLRQAK